MDVARGEMVEKEIDAFISKRHNDRIATEGERQAEEMWSVSERAYFARRDEEQCLERLLAYHEGQAERLSGVLHALVSHHQAEADKYRQLTKGSAA